MPRYEFKEGTSNKFWEITLDGETFTTRWGRIGSAGQEATKEWGSRAEAKREYDKIIASKVKSGYVLVDSGDAPAASKSNPELEAAIEADPANPAPYLVYADWLQSQGDPRGELIVIQHALATSGAGKGELQDRERELLKANSEVWLGILDEDDLVELTWRYGFIQSARLRTEYDSDFSVEEGLEALLASPVGRFVEAITFGLASSDGQNEYQGVVDALVSKKPPTVRELFIGDFEQEESEISWSDIGDVGKLWPAMPKLQRLTLKSGQMKLGKIVAPELREFALQTGGLPASELKSVVNALWPKLEKLEIWFGDDNYGGDCTIDDVTPLLEGAYPATLKHLGLMNSVFTDEIVRALAQSKILKQIKSLDLSMGCMTAEGVATLKQNRDAFKHLELLNLNDNCVEDDALTGLDDICAHVTYDDQSPDRIDEEYRYPAVGE